MNDFTETPALASPDTSWATKYQDCFDREPVARFLESIVEIEANATGYEDEALIFAIDGEWGTGKSFFIKCWMQDLIEQNHFVAHFDAWKNDLHSDPFVPLITSINHSIKDWMAKNCPATTPLQQESAAFLKSHLQKAKKAIKYVVAHQAAKHLGEAVTDLFSTLGTDDNDTPDQLAKVYADNLAEESKQHENYLEAIEQLKASLSNLPNLPHINPSPPKLFIFIDELDRCRPNYAISVIEVIKHIINTKNVCFVVSTNIAQLSQSLKAVYGHDFDSKRYLKRIFHFEYQLPQQSLANFIENLPNAKEIYCIDGEAHVPKFLYRDIKTIIESIYKDISYRDILKIHRSLRIAIKINKKKNIKIDLLTALLKIIRKYELKDYEVLSRIKVYENGENITNYTNEIKFLENSNHLREFLQKSVYKGVIDSTIYDLIHNEFNRNFSKLVEFSKASTNVHLVIENLKLNE